MFIITTTETTPGGVQISTDAPMNAETPLLPKLLLDVPLCQARTRRGTLCRCPALRGKARCRYHGGRSVGLSGERNGNWKHGNDTQEAVALRRAAGRLLKTIGAANDE